MTVEQLKRDIHPKFGGILQTRKELFFSPGGEKTSLKMEYGEEDTHTLVSHHKITNPILNWKVF